ncbi:DUF4384 domain-containing protein [Deltaproteobacteria bacterium TL4]
MEFFIKGRFWLGHTLLGIVMMLLGSCGLWESIPPRAETSEAETSQTASPSKPEPVKDPVASPAPVVSEAKPGASFFSWGSDEPDAPETLAEAATVLIWHLEKSLPASQSLPVELGNFGKPCDSRQLEQEWKRSLLTPLQQSRAFSIVPQNPKALLNGSLQLTNDTLRIQASLLEMDPTTRIIRGTLASVEVTLPRENIPREWLIVDMNGKLDTLFCELRNSQGYFSGQKIKTLFENLTYQDSRLGSPMTAYLSEHIRTQAIRHNFELILPEQITSQSRTRGGRRSTTTDTRPDLGPAVLGQSMGAEVVLSGTIWDTGKMLELKLSLFHSSEHRLLDQQNVILPKSQLPNYRLAPEVKKSAPVKEALRTFALSSASAVPDSARSGSLDVQIWTDRGQDITLKEGEKLHLFYSVNHDSYVRVYYLNAKGLWMDLFPDGPDKDGWVSANLTQEFPPLGVDWEFTVEAPFGHELIMAFASRTPFPKIESQQGESGFNEFQLTTPQLIQQLFQRGTPASKASLTVTTLAKESPNE